MDEGTMLIVMQVNILKSQLFQLKCPFKQMKKPLENKSECPKHFIAPYMECTFCMKHNIYL